MILLKSITIPTLKNVLSEIRKNKRVLFSSESVSKKFNFFENLFSSKADKEKKEVSIPEIKKDESEKNKKSDTSNIRLSKKDIFLRVQQTY